MSSSHVSEKQAWNAQNSIKFACLAQAFGSRTTNNFLCTEQSAHCEVIVCDAWHHNTVVVKQICGTHICCLMGHTIRALLSGFLPRELCWQTSLKQYQDVTLEPHHIPLPDQFYPVYTCHFSTKHNLTYRMGGSGRVCMQLWLLIILLPQGALNRTFREKRRKLHHSCCCQEASDIAQHWQRIRCPADNGSNPKVDEQGTPQRSKQK